jgi:hypothetical protein
MKKYYELVVKGDDRDLIPYLVGAGVRGVYFAEESGLHVHALRERIRHLGEVQHIVCTAESRDEVHDALAKAAPRYHFEVKEERAVSGATFRFGVETPSRDIASKVRATVAAPPAGVTIAGFAPREETDPSSRGSEMYSHVHEYFFTAEGTVAGDIAGVIEMRRLLDAIDFVKCREIDLEE